MNCRCKCKCAFYAYDVRCQKFIEISNDSSTTTTTKPQIIKSRTTFNLSAHPHTHTIGVFSVVFYENPNIHLQETVCIYFYTVYRFYFHPRCSHKIEWKIAISVWISMIISVPSSNTSKAYCMHTCCCSCCRTF